MQIILIISLAIFIFILVKKGDIKDWQITTAVIAYSIFALVSAVFHPVLGIPVLILDILVVLIVWGELYLHSKFLEITPIPMYIILFLFSVGNIVEITEAIFGRLF